jgi:hypothetical protein
MPAWAASRCPLSAATTAMAVAEIAVQCRRRANCLVGAFEVLAEHMAPAQRMPAADMVRHELHGQVQLLRRPVHKSVASRESFDSIFYGPTYDANPVERAIKARLEPEKPTAPMWKNRLDHAGIVRQIIRLGCDGSEARNMGMCLKGGLNHPSCVDTVTAFPQLFPSRPTLVITEKTEWNVISQRS